MTTKLHYAYELDETDCCVCGVVFAIPARMLASASKNKGNIYCPNGHSLTWKTSEAERLRDELAAEKKRKDAALARANEAEQRATKTQQQLTRLKKRAQAGACPCCHRTFANMQRHMTTKHPGYADT